ncbi:hypothetical protein I7V34_18325 [Bacillus sp. V3]|nr:hypothetical protein I7V34_18325 [Bacillus sp. V3]
MKNKTVTFKESRIIPTTFLLVLMGFLFSFVPDENWSLLALNIGIAGLCSILFFVFWLKTKHESKRYFSLLSYVMIIALAIYFVIPFFRVFAGQLISWLGMVLIIIMIILPFLNRESIATGFVNPSKNPVRKYFYTVFTLIFGFGVIFFSTINFSENPNAVALSSFFFIFALLFLFIAPIMLIKPSRVEELEE